MSFPSSNIGLPQSLNFGLPPSLSDSAKTSTVHLAPDGITSVVGANTTGNLFIVPSGLTPKPVNYPFNSQIVSFSIPSGMGSSTFLDCNSTCLSFTLTYTATMDATTAGAGLTLNLTGSAASFFDSLILYSNNIPIESIGQYGLLQNYLLSTMVSQSERSGGFSVAMGCDTDSATGIDMGFPAATGAASYRYNFSIPLCSIIGYNSDKMFPIGSINNLQLIMQTAQFLPFTSTCATACTGAVLSNITLSEFQLNLKYLDIGDVASSLLNQSLQDGKIFMKSTTFTNSAVTVPNGSSGNSQLLLQLRNSSVKSILSYFCTDKTGFCLNGYFDAISPALTSRQLQIGSMYVPNRPISDCASGACGYNYLLQALTSGGGLSKSCGSVVNVGSDSVVLPSVPTGSDSRVCTPAASGSRVSIAGSADIASNKFPHAHFHGYDLERASGVLLSGYNTRSSPPFLNINIAVASNQTVISQNWAMSDVILVFDLASRSVQAFI